MTFEREPGYFLGASVMGDRCTTIVAEESDNGALAGTACIARAERYVRGLPTDVGYIGQMRVAPKYQGYMLPLRGLLALEKTLSADLPDLFFTVIPNENRTARAIFSGNVRRSFPVLTEVAQLMTVGIDANRTRAAPSGVVKKATREKLPRIIAFLQEEGQRREFFPKYRTADFTGGARVRGFSPSGFFVVEEHGRILGVAGLWNQSSYKQSVVQGYSGWLRVMKPIYNAFAPLLSLSRLPQRGDHIRSAYLSFLAVKDDDPGILSALIDAACTEARQLDLDFVILGLSENDPQLGTARRYSHISYRSTLYAFSLKGGLSEAAVDPDRPCCPEAATL